MWALYANWKQNREIVSKEENVLQQLSAVTKQQQQKIYAQE